MVFRREPGSIVYGDTTTRIKNLLNNLPISELPQFFSELKEAESFINALKNTTDREVERVITKYESKINLY